MVTVRELLNIPILKRLKIVGGRSGLDNLVSHVTVLEIPDVTKWIKRNGFIITSFYSIQGNLDEQLKILDKLIEHGCSCLAIKTGEYIKEIDKSIIKKADSTGIVLLEIPADLNYIDIIYSSMEKILKNKDYDLLIQDYFKDMIFNQSGDNIALIEKGKTFGFNISEDYSLAINITSPQICNVNEELKNLIHKVTANSNTYIPMVHIDGSLIVFLISPSKKFIDINLQSIIDSISKLIATNNLSTIKIGIGSIGKEPQNIKNSYYSSINAIKAGKLVKPNEFVYSYENLEIYCKLISCLEENGQAMFQNLSNKLNEDDLLLTLEKYFEHNMDINKVAKSMFIHKNTVRYRLNKISNITGLDINTFEGNFKLYLFLLYTKISKTPKSIT